MDSNTTFFQISFLRNRESLRNVWKVWSRFSFGELVTGEVISVWVLVLGLSVGSLSFEMLSGMF